LVFVTVILYFLDKGYKRQRVERPAYMKYTGFYTVLCRKIFLICIQALTVMALRKSIVHLFVNCNLWVYLTNKYFCFLLPLHCKR